MKNISYSIFFLSLFIVNSSVALEVKLVSKFNLSQEKILLLHPMDFAVTEDEVLIFTDAKDGNIKLYDNSGKFIKSWGRRGPGPDEFQGVGWCDYRNPYLIILDAGKMKVFVYKRLKDNGFQKINKIYCMGGFSNIGLYKDNVIIDDYIVSKNGKKYSLYMKDFQDKKTSYLLPLEMRYGFRSKKKYERNRSDISKVTSQIGFLDIAGDNVYFALDARLRITKINLKTKEIEFFGKETENYVRPRVTAKIKKAFAQRSGKQVREEKMKMSWVVGVFSDKDIVGLLYTNLDKASSLWKVTLQLYSSDGEFLEEENLSDAVDYGYSPRNFYNKENGCLYVLSKRLNGEFIDEYTILKYKITR